MLKSYYKYKARKEMADYFLVLYAGLIGIGNVARYIAALNTDRESVAFAAGYDACVQTSYKTRDKLCGLREKQGKYFDVELCEAYCMQISRQINEIELILSDNPNV